MSPRRRPIVILGCGPAGLFAAHAVRTSGAEPIIISKKRRSEMYGAQYLHTAIPGLSGKQGPLKTVEYRFIGELDDYLRKVYGAVIPDRSAITKDSLVGVYPSWDIRAAYHAAFEIYHPDIISGEVNAASMPGIFAQFRPKLVISTIPAPSLCADPALHAFDVRRIWAIGDAPERGIFAPRYSDDPNVIWYNGESSPAWYRYSLINGYAAMEWPEDHKPPIPEVAAVDKPVGTTCDCWMGNKRHPLVRLGRYGAWNRHGHSHQAYWRTLRILKEMGI
jgi:hypothetical protein